jgi:hypothetical protein
MANFPLMPLTHGAHETSISAGALGTVGNAGKPGRPGCLVRFPCLGAIPRDKSGHNFPTRSGLCPHEMRDLSLYA